MWELSNEQIASLSEENRKKYNEAEDLTHLQCVFDAQTKIKHTATPYGKFKGPLSPSWSSELEKCKSEEDLFALVMPTGFINPDAFNEVQARGLYPKYCEWKRKQAEREPN
jgi:hypothetical protein